MHPLESILNQKIQNDSRPEGQRHYLAGAGRKRTQITHAAVVPLEAGDKIIQQTDTPQNAGPTKLGVYAPGPLLPTAVAQGQVGDCYLLASVLSIIYIKPTFFDDIIYPLTPTEVVVQYFFAGQIVRIHTTLLVSTIYNNPNDADIRVELLEKTYGLLRSGVNDYKKIDFGSGHEVYRALGLMTSIPAKTPAGLSGALAAGKVCNLITSAQAPSGWVPQHCYAIRGYDAQTQNIIIQNPWYGGQDIVVDPATLALPNLFIGTAAGTFPAVKLLQAPTPTPTAPALTLDVHANVPIDGDKATIASGKVFSISWTSNGDSVVVTNSRWNSRQSYKPTDSTMFTATANDLITITATRADGATISKTINLTVTKDAPTPIPTPQPTPTNVPINISMELKFDGTKWVVVSIK